MGKRRGLRNCKINVRLSGVPDAVEAARLGRYSREVNRLGVTHNNTIKLFIECALAYLRMERIGGKLKSLPS